MRVVAAMLLTQMHPVNNHFPTIALRNMITMSSSYGMICDMMPSEGVRALWIRCDGISQSEMPSMRRLLCPGCLRALKGNH
jgi:hypothetical protein